MYENNSKATILLNDKEWGLVEGEVCRATDFTESIAHSGKFKPYASIMIECKKVPNKKIKGYIAHKIDFMHLFAAFKKRILKQNEEVLIRWSKKHYKLKLLRFLPSFWPKLWVMVCQKGAFELMSDQNYKPELKGEERFLAEKPIVDWKPEIME